MGIVIDWKYTRSPTPAPHIPPCLEAVEDPRVLPADTKSEAREVIVDSFRCPSLLFCPQEAFSYTLLIVWESLDKQRLEAYTSRFNKAGEI